MKVEFLIAFDNYQAGDVAEFVSWRTEDLLSRKIVKLHNDTSEKDAKIAELKKELAILKGKLTKQINAAPRNKQITSAANK